MSEMRDELIARAKARAGYALEDSPCEPRRSAYVDGAGGDAMYQRGVERWRLYRDVMLDPLTRRALTPEDLRVLGSCLACWELDGEHTTSCPTWRPS